MCDKCALEMSFKNVFNVFVTTSRERVRVWNNEYSIIFMHSMKVWNLDR